MQQGYMRYWSLRRGRRALRCIGTWKQLLCLLSCRIGRRSPRRLRMRARTYYRNASSMIGRAKSILFVSLLIPLYSRSDLIPRMSCRNERPSLHALDNCVHLMSSSCPFSFLAVEHNSMFNLDHGFQVR